MACVLAGGHYMLIEPWVALSLAAACFQTLRFVLQKVVSTVRLTPTGATFARFLYSAPLIAAIMVVYASYGGTGLLHLSLPFWAYASGGAVAQVMATIAVVTLFKSRNFAVGVTLMKTEVILSVLVGIALLGETVSGLALLAVLSGACGVILLSRPPDFTGSPLSLVASRSVVLGLGAGFLFAVSGVCYRGASLEIESADPVLRAGVTLAAVTLSQMVGMALWLLVRDPAQIGAVWRARRVAGWIGILSLAGSFCWFFAFTLQNAALVKAVGQVELVLSLIASVLFFGERSTRRELLGIAVLCGSIILLVLVS